MHGDLPRIHHTLTHAKALATVLDRCSFPAHPERTAIPRDEPYGLRSFPAIGTDLAAVGLWRATVTEYDWDYQEHAQAGSGGFGGHVSGGALSILYHLKLGPIFTGQYDAIRDDRNLKPAAGMLSAAHVPHSTH